MANANVTREPSASGSLLWQLGILGTGAYLILRIDFLAVAASLLLATAFASRFLAPRALSGLEAKLRCDAPRARCGEPFSVTLELANRNRFFPVFYPSFDLQEDDNTRIQKFLYKGIIPPKSETSMRLHPRFERRGQRSFTLVAARSSFPFTLYRARKETSASFEPVTVWPRLISVNPAAIIKDRAAPAFPASGHHFLVNDQNEADRIRNYATGDPRRSINWKLTAKLDKPMVIEARSTKEARFTLLLSTSRELWRSESEFERMLSQFASLVLELLERRSLHAVTVDSVHFPMGTPPQTIRLLDALSVVPLGSGLPNRFETRSDSLALRVLPNPKTGIEARAFSSVPAR